jgi:hypothetical protein
MEANGARSYGENMVVIPRNSSRSLNSTSHVEELALQAPTLQGATSAGAIEIKAVTIHHAR